MEIVHGMETLAPGELSESILQRITSNIGRRLTKARAVDKSPTE